LLAVYGMTIFSACTPIVQKPQQNDFFVPVDRVDHKASISDTLIRTSEYATIVEDRLNDSLRVLFRQQNKRLGDLMQQLNLFTNNGKGSNFITADTLDDILSNRNDISNEALLKKIRDQNERLNDAVEQLKLLSKNQRVQHENESRNIVVPVQPAPVQQAPVHTAVQPASGKQKPDVRRQEPTFNFGTAIQLYKNQQYGKAIEIFGKLLNQKIEPQLADRYHFWMGVCYFNLNKGAQAINEFRRVLGYARSEKAEEATFMIGQCYERKGAKQDAKATYEKMLRLYPRGSLAQAAKKKLALLK
jgi:TolA-binding protein